MGDLPWSKGWRLARERSRLAQRTRPGPLRDCLTAPLPASSTALSEAPLLAVDFETTGLDPRRDVILSIGYVPVDGLTIRLGGAGSRILALSDGFGRRLNSEDRRAGDPGRGRVGVGQSATVHGLTDDVVDKGVPLRQGIDEVLTALRGRVLLAHYSAIERYFLNSACRSLYGVELPLSSIDTLELQRRIVAGPTGHAPPGALRLGAAREHFGLPRYRAHDALTDALACAELYLAQMSMLAGGAEPPLRRVLE